ncbi:hypothetical protein [Antrihabitans cavernicola]|uniref:PNPLA domain-containing protein n=1 Tax=Antrihabitans cavernicola TaxID=2495913 RepID=A0A5A7SFY2_9NOCA|nr:hypothetical protein [Spelaeibacter cavernicola]KAA0023577.1 hypothetical protein FOY51_09290 [Spelaeibacter cavernicola]
MVAGGVVARTVIRPDPGPVRRWFSLLVVAVAAAISMSEINRLIATAVADPEIVAQAGKRASIDSVLAPTAFTHRDAWQVWADTTHPGAIALWIVIHVALDLVLVACMFLWLRTVLERRTPERRALRWVVGLEAGEAVVFLIGALVVDQGGAPGWFTWFAAVVTSLKWIAYLGLLINVVRNYQLRHSMFRATRRVWRALWVQRLSAIVVAGVGILALVPKENIFDQGPDVVRSWFDRDGSGIWDAVFAILMSIAIACLLLVQGRQRTERAYAHDANSTAAPDSRPAQLWWWLIAPVVVLVAAVVTLTEEVSTVRWRPLLVSIAIPVALVVISFGIRRWRAHNGTSPPPLGEKPDEEPLGQSTWIAGDVLALAALVVLALAVVRGLVAPVALGLSDVRDLPVVQLIALVVGVAVAVAIPLLAIRPLLKFPKESAGESNWAVTLMDPGDSVDPSGWANLLPVVSFIGVVALARWPIEIGSSIGVIAMVTLVLGIWSLMLGFLIIHLQARQPLELFRELRMEANPFLTFTAVTLILVAWLGGDQRLHEIRHGVAGADAVAAAAARPNLRTTFDRWLASSSACDRTVALANNAGEAKVRPLLLLGASGGGIRAAEWTAGVVTVLSSSSSCGASATMLSSGVSGGSVGLALTRGLPGTTGADPLRLTEKVGESDALAAGLAGLGVGDLVAGASGILLAPNGSDQWIDRAGLIETVWEKKSAAMRQTFQPTDIEGPAGALVFNATSATSKCRVQISQVDLSQNFEPVPSTGDCRAYSGAPAGSIDLLSAGAKCGLPETWATASFISARFPYVTPTARTGLDDSCPKADMQLVDGGYAEESGLGTIADISPGLSAIIRDHNAPILDQIARDRRSASPIVVPLVVYLDDEPGEDLLRDIGRPIAEILAPTQIQSPAHAQLSSWRSLGQRITNELRTSCGSPGNAICAQVSKSVGSNFGSDSSYFLTVAPPTEPSVRAPLGWVLSDESHDSLRKHLVVDRNSASGCAEAASNLCGLLTMLDRP